MGRRMRGYIDPTDYANHAYKGLENAMDTDAPIKSFSAPLRDLLTELRRLTTRNKDLEGRMAASREWQPIETAPKDGTIVLLSDGRDEGCVTAAWSRGEWVYGWHRHDGPMSVGGSTHWMPLPEPPKAMP